MWLREKAEQAKWYLNRKRYERVERQGRRRSLDADDKKDMVYYGFIGAAIVVVITVAMTSACMRISMQRDLKEIGNILNTVTAFLTCATDDEYEEITQELRRGMMTRSLCPEDMEIIDLIPNTSEQCASERAKENPSGQVFLLALNTGELYNLDLLNPPEPPTDSQSYGYAQTSGGYDEVSKCSIIILKNPDKKTTMVTVSGEDVFGILSILRVKELFCEDCISKLSYSVQDSYLPQFVLYAPTESKFIPILENTVQVGDYEIKMSRDEQWDGYNIVVSNNAA